MQSLIIAIKGGDTDDDHDDDTSKIESPNSTDLCSCSYIDRELG